MKLKLYILIENAAERVRLWAERRIIGAEAMRACETQFTASKLDENERIVYNRMLELSYLPGAVRANRRLAGALSAIVCRRINP